MSDSSRSRERAAAAALAGVLVVVLAAVAASAVWSSPRSGRNPQEVATGALGARPVVGPAGASPTSPAELWAAIGGEPAPSTGSPGPGGGVVVAGGAAKRGAPAEGSPTGSPTTPDAVAPGPAQETDSPSAVGPAARLRGVPIDGLDLLDPDVASRMRAAVGIAAPVPDNPPAAPAPTTPPVPAIEAPSPAPNYALGANLLDADSATLEGSTGAWKQWFSDTLTSSANDGNTGQHSLRVTVSALHGWGVELKIWPGFPASPGRYVIGFAAKAETPAVTAATMTVHWHHDTVEIGSTTLTLALTDSWQEGSDLVTAPAGTTYVRIDFRNRAGGPGDRLLLDDVVVAPVAN